MNTYAEHEAAKIINGFLDRFEAPTCIEQQEVVSQAEAWLRNYHKTTGQFRTFAAKAISQNNNQNTH
jgi:hypothetical protein